jgi:hypothetical protein
VTTAGTYRAGIGPKVLSDRQTGNASSTEQCYDDELLFQLTYIKASHSEVCFNDFYIYKLQSYKAVVKIELIRQSI